MKKLGTFQPDLLDRQIEEIRYYAGEGWEDELGQIVVKGVGANDPTWKAFSGNDFGYAFEAAKMNQAWVNFHISHRSNPTQPIFIHIHWSPGTADPGVVRWGVEIIHANPGEAFSSPRTFYLEDAAEGVHQVIECPESEAVSGMIAGGIIKARVFRDPLHVNDTYPGDAFAHFLNLHFRAERTGTPQKEGNLFA